MTAREKRIFTFGYSGRSLSELKWLSERLGATVVDTRYSRLTRQVDFSAKRLEAALSEHYVHIPEFGNVNYKSGGPVKLANPEVGLARIASIVTLGSVILLCVCASREHCHREDVAELLAREFGLPVRHLTRDDLVEGSDVVESEKVG